MSVKFTDNSVKVIAAIEDALIAGLYEAAGMIRGQAVQNSRVRTGQLKNSWNYKVDESKLEAVIGSPEENSLWEEFGTGEYSLNGNGRKGGWVYKDEKGETHFTYGKTPNRTLFSAFNTKRQSAIQAIQNKVKEEMR